MRFCASNRVPDRADCGRAADSAAPDTSASGRATGLDSLLGLRLQCALRLPLSPVVEDAAIAQYNGVLAFLLQVPPTTTPMLCVHLPALVDCLSLLVTTCSAPIIVLHVVQTPEHADVSLLILRRSSAQETCLDQTP